MNVVKTTKLDYINAVRGIAVLMVIVLHVSSVVHQLPEKFLYMCGKGSFGVQLFFVASAFTLFLSYTNRIQAEGENTKYNFFIRRIFRISPMYYLAALCYSLIYYYHPAYDSGKPVELWKVIVNLCYVNGFVPGAINFIPPGGWSVGVEMLFYCCVPFLFAKVKNLKSALTLFVLLTILTFALKLIIRYLLIRMAVDYQTPENWFLYFWFPNQIAVFILGIALFFALKKYSIKSKSKCYSGIIATIFLLLIFTYFIRDFDPYIIVPEHIIVAVFFTVIVFFMAQHPVKILDNKFTRFLGEISFSLYLVHFIVIKLLVDFLPLPANAFEQFFILLVSTLIISGIISRLTYQLIEVKGIKLGNRFIRRKPIKPELNAAL